MASKINELVSKAGNLTRRSNDFVQQKNDQIPPIIKKIFKWITILLIPLFILITAPLLSGCDTQLNPVSMWNNWAINIQALPSFKIDNIFLGCVYGNSDKVRNEFKAGASSTLPSEQKSAVGAVASILIPNFNEAEEVRKSKAFLDANVDLLFTNDEFKTGDFEISLFKNLDGVVRDGWIPFQRNLQIEVFNTGDSSSLYRVYLQCNNYRKEKYDICYLAGFSVGCEGDDGIISEIKNEWEGGTAWENPLTVLNIEGKLKKSTYCSSYIGTNPNDDAKKIEPFFQPAEDRKFSSDAFNINSILHGNTLLPNKELTTEENDFPYYKTYWNPDKDNNKNDLRTITFEENSKNQKFSSTNYPLSWCHTTYKVLKNIVNNPEDKRYLSTKLNIQPLIAVKKIVEAKKDIDLIDKEEYSYLARINDLKPYFKKTRNSGSKIQLSFIDGTQPKIVEKDDKSVSNEKISVSIVKKSEKALALDLMIVLLDKGIISKKNDELNNYGQNEENWVCTNDLNKGLKRGEIESTSFGKEWVILIDRFRVDKIGEKIISKINENIAKIREEEGLDGKINAILKNVFLKAPTEFINLLPSFSFNFPNIIEENQPFFISKNPIFQNISLIDYIKLIPYFEKTPRDELILQLNNLVGAKKTQDYVLCVPTEKALDDMQNSKSTELNVDYYLEKSKIISTKSVKGFLVYDYVQIGESLLVDVDCLKEDLKRDFSDVDCDFLGIHSEVLSTNCGSDE